jgi:RNA polymerase sigma factor (sigma-70 family)
MATSMNVMPVGVDGQPFAREIERVLLGLVPRLVRHFPCLESDDVLTEVLEEAGRKIVRREDLRGSIDCLHGYAWVTLRSVAVSHTRRSASRLRSRTISLDESGGVLARVRAQRATAEQIEHRILLGQLLAKLSPSERKVCQWKREGLSSDEIAGLRGSSPAAVDSLWLRIRKRLREGGPLRLP